MRSQEELPRIGQLLKDLNLRCKLLFLQVVLLKKKLLDKVAVTILSEVLGGLLANLVVTLFDS